MIPIVIGTFLALIGIGVATSHHEEERREPQYIYVPQPAQPIAAPGAPITIIVKDGKVEQEHKQKFPKYQLVPIEEKDETPQVQFTEDAPVIQ